MRKSIVALVSAGLLAASMGSENQLAIAKDGVANSKAAVPAALLGQWQNGSLAAAKFYSSSSRQWNEPSGRGMFLIVEANGEYRLGAGEEVVTTDYYFYQEGSIAINGAEIVLSPQMGSEYTNDVCTHEDDQRASSKDELQAAKLKFQLGADQAGAKLVLINEHGEQVVLRPSAK
jgi:hypothetical protein